MGDYADRGTARIKKKFISLKESGKATNVAKAACARNLPVSSGG